MKKAKKFTLNFLLITFSLTIAIVVAEVALRLFFPNHGLGVALQMENLRGKNNIFTTDPDMGFRPVLNNGHYNEFGTKINNYKLEKPDQVTRLLFLGDSVANRGKISNALREIYGKEKFEYWNAGVESFNTVQEVNFYKKR